MTNVLLNNYTTTANESPYVTDAYADDSDDEKDITITQFKQVLDFVENSESNIVLRGGSPMEHDLASELLLLVSQRRSISNISILTDLTFDEQAVEMIYLLSLEQHVQIVANAIPGHYLTTDEEERFNRNIEYISNMNNVTLDLRVIFNGPEQNTDHITPLVRNYNVNQIHWGIYPHIPEAYGTDAWEYINDVSDPVFEFLLSVSDHDVATSPEPHHLPICALDDEQLHKLSMSGININYHSSPPQPAIHPDMSVTRTYDYLGETQPFDTFDTIDQAVDYFVDTVDAEYINSPIFEECEDCRIYEDDNRSCLSIGLQSEARGE